MRIQSGARNKRLAVSVSGAFLLALAALMFLNAAASLSPAEAEARVRQLLARQVLQNQAVDRGAMTADKGAALARALAGVKSIEFRSVKIGKLLPDYLLRPHRPTFIVRVEMRGSGPAPTVRYFWLPWDGIDSESGDFAWHFAL
jgi:hypothetical protein